MKKRITVASAKAEISKERNFQKRCKRCYVHAKSAEDYLLQRVKIDNVSGCWNWTRGVDKNGYGQCHASKYAKLLGVVRAHQMAYCTWVQKIPKGKIVCHTCDNPSCVNPEHLYAGTWKTNVHDCIRRGRYRNGAKRNPHSDYIISQRGIKTCYTLAEELGLSWGYICYLWRQNGLHGRSIPKRKIK